MTRVVREPRLTLEQRAADRQLVLDVGPVGAGSDVELGQNVPGGLLLYRLRVEVRGAGTDAWPGRKWEAVLFLRHNGMRIDLARLHDEGREVVLARPLAYAVRVGDTLGVHVRTGGAEGGVGHLRITVDYESLDQPVSRLGVVPVRPDAPEPAAADTPLSRSLWQTPVAGRLLAIEGLSTAVPGELLLQDAATGAVLWRHVIQPRGGEGFGPGDGPLRVGIPVEPGRDYQLIRPGREEVGAAAAPVQLLILPAGASRQLALSR